jgi:bifunctional oligoribonuclease and PAP phosphatase NrnA
MRDEERVAAALAAAPAVAVCSHVNPEGDAIGAILGAAQALSAAGKRAVAFNADGVPPWLRHLPGAADVCREAPGDDYACYLVVDTTDPERTGGLLANRPAGAALVNVDHHPGNTRFGDVNWVEPTASSAGEMVYQALRGAGCAVPPDAATNLYAALFTDTGGFRFGNTTPEALRVAAELLSCGAEAADVARRLYGHRDLRELALLGEVLGGLGIGSDGRAAWIEVSLAAQRRAGVGLEVTDEFIQYPRSLHGVEVALAFKELAPDEVRVSLRSNGRLSVATLAERRGGGGHRNAAGCTVRGSLAEAKAALLADVEAALQDR